MSTKSSEVNKVIQYLSPKSSNVYRLSHPMSVAKVTQFLSYVCRQSHLNYIFKRQPASTSSYCQLNQCLLPRATSMHVCIQWLNRLFFCVYCHNHGGNFSLCRLALITQIDQHSSTKASSVYRRSESAFCAKVNQRLSPGSIISVN